MAAPDYAQHLFTSAEAALASLRKHGVAPAPENYSLWFAHHAGYSPGLSRMIRVLEDSRQPIDEARHRELFEHFLAGDQTARLHEASRQAQALMAAVQGDLGSLRGQTERYAATLDGASSRIIGNAQAEDLALVVEALTIETARMRDKAAMLEQQLEQRSGQMSSLRHELEEAQQALNTDPLTGVGNRRLYEQMLRRLASEAVERDQGLVLLFIDVDHFKRFNDEHGHAIGDVVLRLIAGRLQQVVHGRDVVARYGGEEFAVLLPQASLGDAVTLAEQIRAEISSKRIQLKADRRDLGVITVSIGVSAYHHGEPLTAFAERADRALYAAKRGGRDRVVAEG